MKACLPLLALLLVVEPAWAVRKAENADALVAKAEVQTCGKTFQSAMTMVVDHDGSTRTLAMNLTTVGREKAIVKIRKPAKDRDSGDLRIELNLWQYLANIERIIKIPPSMMLQNWQGSDFTNDDLVRSSSLARDYTHRIVGHETVDGHKTVKIDCDPKPTAPVVWGKVVLWLREEDAVPIKEEFYTENGELIKVMNGKDIKSFGSHTIPTTMIMTSLKKSNSKTTLHYDTAVFDKAIDGSVFTQENLRKAVRD